MKSEDRFSFHLDGESSIDAIVLSEIIMDLTELTKIAALEENPDAYLKMNVTAFKNGSFQIDFSAICEFTENLISNSSQLIQLASTAVTTVKGFFEIKKLLKGNKPKSIHNLDDGKITVTGQDNHSVTVNKSSGAVINNFNIDNLVVKISSCVGENNKDGGFSFKTSTNTTHFSNKDVTQMSKPLPIIEEEQIRNTIILADLPIKKADLLGKSAWSFIFNNKTIDAKIDDEDFIDLIHNGKISIHSGDYITAELVISVKLNENSFPDENSTKYTVRKVVGEIKNNIDKIKPFI